MGNDTSVPCPLAWQGQTMCVDLDLIMGSATCSDPGFAVLQLRLAKQEKGNSFVLLGASFTRTALAKTAMTSPSLCFLPSARMCQHCIRCVVARRARPFSPNCVFHVLFCVFHVLPSVLHVRFYSKRRSRLTDCSDGQTSWICLLGQFAAR